MHSAIDTSETLCRDALHCARRALYASVASGSLMLTTSCTAGSDGDNASGSTVSEVSAVVADSVEEKEEEFYHADNDIAMTVRSMADAINVGEPLDSLDYNFSGVLTDGMGSPLFVDYEGLPGQWEVDVLGPREVRIRNIGVGDLFPDSLVEYLAQTLSADEREEIRFKEVEVYDVGDARIEEYSYGHTRLHIETRPELLPTGEVGPKLEITLRADSIPALNRPVYQAEEPCE